MQPPDRSGTAYAPVLPPHGQRIRGCPLTTWSWLCVAAPLAPGRHLERHRGARHQGLKDHAVSLRQFGEQLQTLRLGRRLQVELHPDVGEPHGAPLRTPRVPLKSRSPSTLIVPLRTGISNDVATADKVTPAQAASACSSMSPEQAISPVPPVAGCKPAATIACPVCTEQLTPSPRLACALKVTRASSGFSA